MKKTNASAARSRTLNLETLENRELLSASPWNDVASPSETTFADVAVCCDDVVDLSDVATASETPTVAMASALSGSIDGTLRRLGQNPDSLTEDFVFNLNSKPGSEKTIYLDFTGATTTGTWWNSSYTGGAAITTPAYDVNGDTTSFSKQELRNIYEIWLRVSEDYMPFDVNVTTKEPTIAQLIRTDFSDDVYGVRVCLGGSNDDWLGEECCGIAVRGSFKDNKDTPVFVFTEGNAVPIIADSASHEVGHSLNLSHDGTSTSGYYYGGGGWGPIMGGTSGQNLVQWSKGEYVDANNHEDDLAIITQNGLSYRSDDHGDSFATSTPLTLSVPDVIGSGVIERNVDVDYFSIALDGSQTSITVGGIQGGVTNLDVLVRLYDSSQRLVAEVDSASALTATLNVGDYAAGQYYLTVEGVGSQLYSDYGSLGAYTIETSVTTDIYESNDSQNNAYDLGALSSSKTISALIDSNVDDDFFTFTLNGDYTAVDIKIDYGYDSSTSCLATQFSKDEVWQDYFYNGSKRYYSIDANGTFFVRVFPTTWTDTIPYTLTIVPFKAELTEVSLGTNVTKTGFPIKASVVSDDLTVAYQWYRGTSSNNMTAISGATSPTYVPTSSDVGYYLKVVASGSENCTGTVSAQTSGKVTEQTVWTVTSTSNSTSASGTLPYVLAKASAGDRITFDSSLDGQTIKLSSSLTVSKDLVIDASNLSKGLTLDGQKQRTVMFVYSDVDYLVLRGLTFSNGFNSGSFRGAGLSFSGGELEAFGCVFKGNHKRNENSSVTLRGAGVVVDGNATFTNCEFVNNLQESDCTYSGGGAIASYDSDVSIRVYSCVFEGNIATHGGAIYSEGPLYVERSTFRDNKTGWGDGGAIRTYGLTVIVDSRFETGWARYGGAVYSAASLIVDGSEFIGNVSRDYGGALYSTGAYFGYIYSGSGSSGKSIEASTTLSVDKSVFEENANTVSYGFGGAIDSSASVNIIQNSLFDNNSTPGRVGALAVSGDELRLINCTIVNNTAQGEGGGIGIYINGNRVGCYNNIILFNTSEGSSSTNDVYSRFSSIAGYNNLSSFTSWGTGSNNVVYDASRPLFNDADSGDYTLPEDSQAIDRGANGFVETEADLAGHARIQNGTVDLGAYEYGDGDTLVSKIGVANYASNKATLSWKAIDGASTYILKISKDDGKTWVTLAKDLTATTRDVSGLYAGKSYSFRVYAYSGAGALLKKRAETVFAPVSAATTTSTYSVSKQLKVTTTAASDATYTVKWYKVTPNGDAEIVGARNSLTYSPEDSDYNLKVVVKGTGISAGCSSELIFTKPTVGTISVDYDATTRRATLSWNKLSKAVSYTIRISKDAGATWSTYAKGVAERAYEVSGLYAGKSYEFRVHGVDADGVTLDNYHERTIAPISLSSETEFYTVGTAINVSKTAACNASYTLKWYEVTANGLVEIVSARNRLTYTPASGDHNVKIVATGLGDSAGCNYELTFKSPITVGAISIYTYDGTTRAAKLKWPKLSGAVKYNLQISKDGGSTWTNYARDVTTLSYNVNGLYPGKSYSFRTRGINAAGETLDNYNECVFAPFGLKATSDTYVEGKPIKLTKIAAADATATIKWYNVTSGGDVEIVAARNKLSYTPTTSDSTIKVVATGTGVSKKSGAELTFTPASRLAFEYDATTRRATMSWDPVDGAATYKVNISRDGGATWTTYVKNASTTTATVSGLYAGKSYDFRVYGVGADGTTFSSCCEGTFAPIALKSSTTSYAVGSAITVSLTAAENAAATIRWYRETSSGDVEIVSARDSLSYTPTDSNDNIRIVATGTGVSQGASSEVTVAAPAAKLSFDYDSSARQAVLGWKAISGAASYTVKILKPGSTTWSTYKKGVVETSTTANGLYAGKAYGFRVYGVNSSGATLDFFYETTFTPISASASTTVFDEGDTISLTVVAGDSDSYEVNWYTVTDAGDVRIPSAFGLLAYTPSNANNPVKAIVTGLGDSFGCDTEIVVGSQIAFDYDSSTRRAVLSWNPISGASSYTLKISKNGGSTWTNYRTGLTDATATVNGLYVGNSYGFRVYGVSSSGSTLSSFKEATLTTTADSNVALDEVFADFFEEELFEEI